MSERERTPPPTPGSAPSRSESSGGDPGEAGFAELLTFLDPDPAQAGEAYARTRSKLVRLFLWRGAAFPEDLADETLTRVARKLGEGETIRTEDPYRYVSGVARLVFHEAIRRQQRERKALEADAPPLAVPAEAEVDDGEHQRRLDCLRRGIALLPPASQRLILSYYAGEKGRKIRNRKRLAADLRIPMNALRIRAHRIRLKLEASVSACLEEEG